MPLTPIDILHRSFPRSIRGYRAEAVEDFLREVAADYEAALAENARMKEQLALLERELQRYRDMETALHEALVLANKTAEEVRNAARHEAQLVLEQARTQAKEELEQQRRAAAVIEQERARFVREFRALLMSYLADLEGSRLPPQADDGLAVVQTPSNQASSLPNGDGGTPPAASSE